MAHLESYDSFQTKKAKEQKKRAKEKSNSKEKDVNKNGKFVIKKGENYGTIIEVRYNDAYVFYQDKVVKAHLRNDINYPCNQVLFPGDKVILEADGEDFVINNMIARTSLLSRVKKDSTRLDSSIGTTKNIAANINLAAIVVAAKNPPLHPKFIDRYLMVLQNSGIDSIICLNKADLKDENEEKILDIYRNLGIPVIETSTLKKEGIDQLAECLRGKQTIFVGNSGVGKSSLTNALMNSEEIKTSHVSEKSGKGRHTTTTSKYYVWDEESSIIDTPGIRSLDVSSFQPQEIQDYFQEFEDWACKCKFSNCLHFKEPENLCMVKQGVKSGIINKNRYASYIRILGNVLNEKQRETDDLDER